MSDSTSTAAGLGERPRDEDAPRSGEKGPGRIRRIGIFYRQVVAELRKVIWPTRRELVTYTGVVLVFVLAMVAVISVFDFAFGKAVLAIFGA